LFFNSKQQVYWWPIEQGAIFFCDYDRAAFCSSLFDEFSIPLTESLCRSVEKRQAEYLAGRYCAKHALRAINLDAPAISSGKHREPLWPEGVVGSISHTNELAVACVSKSPHILGIGIDLEKIIDSETCKKIERMILTNRDRENTPRMLMSEEKYCSLVFSLKESFFKAAFNQVGKYFDFDSISIIEVDEIKCSAKFIINYNLSEKLKKGDILMGLYKQLTDMILVTTVVILAKNPN
jgi:4'-phosphopantetheinyl transferase EntD